MKKLLIMFVMLVATSSVFAVGGRSLGNNASVYAYKFEGHYYIILSFNDTDNYRLIDYTVFKIKLKDGTVLRLEGTDGTKALNFRTFGGECSGQKQFAMFRIKMEDIEKLKDGVEKIAINTIPKVYALSNWMDKKRFGMYLYNDFMNLKDEIED